VFLQNDSLNGLLMGHHFCVCFILTFHIFGRHIEFSSNFDEFFYFEFIEMGSIWLYVDWFPQSLTVSEINLTESGHQKPIPKFELFNFSSNFNAYFPKNDRFFWLLRTLNKLCYFILKRHLKVAQTLKFCIIGRHI